MMETTKIPSFARRTEMSDHAGHNSSLVTGCLPPLCIPIDYVRP